MNCEEVIPEIEAYALAALPEEEMSAIEEHLKSCASCAGLLRQYNLTLEGLALEGSAGFQPAPGHKERFQAKLSQRPQLRPGSATTEELAQAAQKNRQKQKEREKITSAPGWWRKLAPVRLALTLAVVLALGLWGVNLQGQLDQQQAQNRAIVAQVSQQSGDLEQLKQLNAQLLDDKNKLATQTGNLNNENVSLKQQISQLSQANQQAQTAQNISLLLTKPGATTRTALNDKFGVTVLMAPAERDVALFAHSWPELKPGQEYHVWLYHSTGALVSGGPLALTPLPAQNLAEALIGVPEPMSNYTTLFVTIEAPGAKQPSGPEIVRDKLA